MLVSRFPTLHQFFATMMMSFYCSVIFMHYFEYLIYMNNFNKLTSTKRGTKHLNLLFKIIDFEYFI